MCFTYYILISREQFLSLFTVYLNVTDLTSYKVGWDTLCIRWSPHRSATSYRLKLNPTDGKWVLFFAFSGNIIVLHQWHHQLFGLVASTNHNDTSGWILNLRLLSVFIEWWEGCKEGVLIILKLIYTYQLPGVTCTLQLYFPVCSRVHNHHTIWSRKAVTGQE